MREWVRRLENLAPACLLPWWRAGGFQWRTVP